MASIDINSDMGESFGDWVMGNDMAMLESISSANVACGFHAGDPDTMFGLVRAAKARGVAVGAHPGLQDLKGFGRRVIDISVQEAYTLTVYQVGAMMGFTRAAGIALHHVKTHGALYQMSLKNEAMADAIVQAVKDVDPGLLIYVANANMIRAAEKAGMRMAHEVYADRTYTDEGTLTPRSQPNAMIHDVEQAITQVKRMILDGVVRSTSGKDIPIRADSVCVHGDSPGAVAISKRLREGLEAEGIVISNDI